MNMIIYYISWLGPPLRKHCIAGPRVCLGKNMAETEAVFVIAELARRFKLSLVEGHVVRRTFGLTNHTKSGVVVNVEKR
jgi:cytochrome P450